jgi:hypothetical protein
MKLFQRGGTMDGILLLLENIKVASGVYIYFISAQDGVETKVKKM